MAAPRLAQHPTSQPPLEQPLSGRLWVRLFQRFTRPPRRLKLTREGRYFIAITLGVGFAAINTGNNLLYLLLGLLLALIIVSGVLSEFSLGRLTVVRRLPTRAQVGRAHLVEIEVYNHKSRLPSYAIEIEDLREGHPADKRCFFLKISPGSAQVAAYRRTPSRRGIDQHVGFRIATRFPFGLFEKSRELAATGSLVVYPATDPTRVPQRSRTQRDGTDGPVGAGRGDEILGVRPMRDGDDPRDIYWRKSTHLPRPVLRDRAVEHRRQMDLHLDDVLPKEERTPAAADSFERRIREVASRAVAHVRAGDTVTVLTTSGARARATPSTGADPVLRFLALIGWSDAPSADGNANTRRTG